MRAFIKQRTLLGGDLVTRYEHLAEEANLDETGLGPCGKKTAHSEKHRCIRYGPRNVQDRRQAQENVQSADGFSMHRVTVQGDSQNATSVRKCTIF